MLTETDIASLIRSLAKAKGWKDTYAARLATGSGDTLVRLDAGINLTLPRAAKILNNISRLWPSDLAWPEDIPRPDTKEDASGASSNPRKQVSEAAG